MAGGNANDHRYNRRDPEDQAEAFFLHMGNRARMNSLLAGKVDEATADKILQGTPHVEVKIWADGTEVTLVGQ